MTEVERKSEMFNLKQMALSAGLLTLALSSSAGEWPKDDRDLDLAPLKALPFGTGGVTEGLKFAQPAAVEPMAAAFFAGPGLPVAIGEQGQEAVQHTLESAVIGFGLGEQDYDYKIGDYLSVLPTYLYLSSASFASGYLAGFGDAPWATMYDLFCFSFLAR